MPRIKRIPLAQYMRQMALNSKKSDVYKRNLRSKARMVEAYGKYIGKVIYSNSFTTTLMEDFVYYIRSRPQEYAANTVRNYYDKTTNAITRAYRDGYAVNWGWREVAVKTEEPASISLTTTEIEALFKLKNLSREAYAARELFVIACCTGMRHGDIKELTMDNFSGGNVIRKTKKTGATVIIPQHKFVKEIIRRNNNEIPRLRSQQAYNTMVKRLCRRAGITKKILVERTRGLRVERKLTPKHQLVSSHTARRSLATNMYLAGIPPARIMLITGHTTESAFFRYIRINKQENARELASHPFFN